MRSPSEIAAEALRDELYARATFAKLIVLPAQDFRAAIEHDPRAQTEFMARHILDHFSQFYTSIPSEHAVELVEAARTAARSGEPHLRCRAEKDLAFVLCSLGRFANADSALRSGESLASRSIALEPHQAALAFVREVLCDTLDDHDQTTRYLEQTITVFEKHGAHDRVSAAREYDAFRRASRGEYAVGLAIYQDVARRARELRCADEMSRAYYNIGLCYRSLGDFPAAERSFRKAARIHKKRGVVVLEAKTLRCAARMAIRMRGDAAVVTMDPAKDLFLTLGAAGEVCRSTVAIIDELLLRDPETDVRSYSHLLAEEAVALGVISLALPAVDSLHAAAESRHVTAELLQETWDAFGPTCALPAISAVATVNN
ncbi:MAG: tetratricopeptide repeat protein [Thermoanaerobaculia bacterium]